jgi:hypothetical protein
MCHQIHKNEFGRAFSMCGGIGRCLQVLVGKPEGTRPIGRPRHRWEDNIKMDFLGVGWEGGHGLD